MNKERNYDDFPTFMSQKQYHEDGSGFNKSKYKNVFNSEATPFHPTSSSYSFNPFAEEKKAPVTIKKPALSYSQVARKNTTPNQDVSNLSIRSEPSRSDLRPLCTFAIKNNCRFSDGRCRNAHGLSCPSCNLNLLHPDVSYEVHWKEHVEACSDKKLIEGDKKYSNNADAQMECGICMEKVLFTPCARFGIMLCEHPFCLTCIRQWRSNSSSISDPNLVRTCPICRSTSFFIIPSTVWVSGLENKEKLAETYRHNLSQIPCKHFNYGSGECPFGTSCFYDHQYPDGTRPEVSLRHLHDKDTEVKILDRVKLSDFFEAKEKMPY